MFYRLIFTMMMLLTSALNADFLKEIKTFEADFEQKIINSSEKEIFYKGKIFIKEPYYILWRYQEPILKNVYIINNFAIIDEPELEQAILTKLQDEMDIIELITKAEKVSENRYVAKIYGLEYSLITQNSKIQKIEYIDQLENRVFITFSNIKQNEEIDEEIFKFLPPEHYDIIRK